MKFGRTITINTVRAIVLAPCLLVALSAQAGSCNYTQENMFAGPFKVCAEKVTEERCETLGTEGSNANAVYTKDSCNTANTVGVCKLERFSLTYYTGNAEELEVSCAFQGGEWK